jgi:DNA processing protein
MLSKTGGKLMSDNEQFLFAMMALRRVNRFGERKMFELAPNVVKMFDEDDFSPETLCRLANRDTITPRCTITEIRSWLEKSQSEYEEWAKDGIKVITAYSTDYPSLLKEIPTHPFFFYFKGDIAPLSRDNIAIVGTREPTSEGRRQAKSIGKQLVKEGYGIVSGLALGCDTAGHEGALDGDGYTCAILAHGLDIVTPAKNRELAARILENGGALVSEHKPGVPPTRRYYAMRNRIQSALSSHVIVIETTLTGGTMSTARYAVEQNRSLGVLNLSPLDNNSQFSEGVSEISHNLSGKIWSSTDEVMSYILRDSVEEE